MNENDTTSTTDNIPLSNDYTDSINILIDSINNQNETLKLINDNLQFLKDYYEITEEEQKLIDDNLEKDSESLINEKEKEREKDLELLITGLEESSLNDIHNELKLLNDKTLENNILFNDSSDFISFAFILILGLLASYCLIRFVKSIFNSFNRF